MARIYLFHFGIIYHIPFFISLLFRIIFYISSIIPSFPESFFIPSFLGPFFIFHISSIIPSFLESFFIPSFLGSFFTLHFSLFHFCHLSRQDRHFPIGFNTCPVFPVGLQEKTTSFRALGERKKNIHACQIRGQGSPASSSFWVSVGYFLKKKLYT